MAVNWHTPRTERPSVTAGGRSQPVAPVLNDGRATWPIKFARGAGSPCRVGTGVEPVTSISHRNAASRRRPPAYKTLYTSSTHVPGTSASSESRPWQDLSMCCRPARLLSASLSTASPPATKADLRWGMRTRPVVCYRPAAILVYPAILEPERPRRRRSSRIPATAASSPTRSPCVPYTARARGRVIRLATGHHHTGQRPVVQRRPSGLSAHRASHRGIRRDARRAAAAAAGARPGQRRVRPGQGRLETCTEILNHLAEALRR